MRLPSVTGMPKISDFIAFQVFEYHTQHTAQDRWQILHLTRGIHLPVDRSSVMSEAGRDGAIDQAPSVTTVHIRTWRENEECTGDRRGTKVIVMTKEHAV